MDTLGKRIKAARDHKSMTQAQLAQLSGVAQGDISKLENGHVAGSTKVVQLARALQCDPYWLATGEGQVWGQTADEQMEFDGRGGNVVGIPVLGSSEFLPGGVEIDESDSSTSGVVLGSGVHEGYAVKVLGDANAPVLKEGQFVVLERCYGSLPPGELALFRLSSGPDLLMEFLRETENAFHVDSPSWGDRKTIRKDDVRQVDAVVAIVSGSRWRKLP